MKPIINIAILAHVDAGKTSLTEQLLFHAGALKTAGNVDKGTAATDFLKVERDRGISVASSHVSIQHHHLQINIIDTPGHADFMSEVERSLIAVDAVILIISAADGVQAQTRVLWRILDKLQIPRLVLINKIDRDEVDIEELVLEIKSELSDSCVLVQSLLNKGNDGLAIESLHHNLDDINSDSIDFFTEQLLNNDDELMEAYLDDDKLDKQKLEEVYKHSVATVKIHPILLSIAKTGFGVEELLDEISHLFSATKNILEQRFSAVVFNISHHRQYGKLAHLRLFSGVLQKKDLVFNQRISDSEKVNLIKTVFSDKLVDVDTAQTGEIVSVSGLDKAIIGDVLGEVIIDKPFTFSTVPILTVQVKPKSEQDYIKLSQALSQLNFEDPLLQFQWFKDEKEFHIKVNGWIQIEILKQLLFDRFFMETEFLPPSVIYKETPSANGFGYEEYTMPKPCWAVIKFKIEAAEQGSGITYHSEVGVNDILLKYQKEIDRSISLALEQGIKGWEVTDLKITLVGGEDHNIHSRAGDFVVATPMAMLNGLKEIGTDLLEPVMKFVIHGPDDILGQVSSDLLKMRGEFEQPELLDGRMILRGKLPVATSLEYPVQLSSRTGGRASIQMEFSAYQKIETDLGMVREFKGISPLDRAKYILKARKAIQ